MRTSRQNSLAGLVDKFRWTDKVPRVRATRLGSTIAVLTFAALLFAHCFLGLVQAAEETHLHAMAGGPEAELGAQAAFDGEGVLWAVQKVSGHIPVSRSEDRGATWLNPVLVTSAPEPTDSGA